MLGAEVGHMDAMVGQAPDDGADELVARPRMVTCAPVCSTDSTPGMAAKCASAAGSSVVSTTVRSGQCRWIRPSGVSMSMMRP